MTKHAVRNTQHAPELTMGQLSRLLGIREHFVRRYLRQVDPNVGTSQDNHKLVPLSTLIALRDQSTNNSRLTKKLAQIIRDNSP